MSRKWDEITGQFIARSINGQATTLCIVEKFDEQQTSRGLSVVKSPIKRLQTLDGRPFTRKSKGIYEGLAVDGFNLITLKSDDPAAP